MAILIKGQDYQSARYGAGTALTVNGSSPGELALVVMASQYATTAAIPPDGYVGEVVTAGNRCGYIAQCRLTAPSQTQNQVWYSPNTDDAARQRGALLVLRNVGDVTVTNWQTTPPTPTTQRALYITQQHGVANAPLMEWECDEVVYAGQNASDASWSSLRIGWVHEVPASLTGVAAFAMVEFTEEETPIVVSGVTGTVDDVTGELHVATIEGSARVIGAGVMPKGALSVSDLLSKDWFTIAHRGGSTSWPEHTKRAYTNAVLHGANALEFSCNRSSDGVWFGCHDSDLSRLGGPSGDLTAMTWSEIQTAMAGNQYLPCTLEWLIEKYLPSHVLVIDPKYRSWERIDEYTGILGPYKDHVILKSAGDANWLFERWKARGFTTLGYAYPDAYTQRPEWYLTTLASPNLDILMMEQNADPAAFEEIKGTGKVCLGHIITNKGGYDRMKSYNLRGVMLAGVSSCLKPAV